MDKSWPKQLHPPKQYIKAILFSLDWQVKYMSDMFCFGGNTDWVYFGFG